MTDYLRPIFCTILATDRIILFELRHLHMKYFNNIYLPDYELFLRQHSLCEDQ